MVMSHPGLPTTWASVVLLAMLAILLYAQMSGPVTPRPSRLPRLLAAPFIGPLVTYLTKKWWPLLLLKITVVVLFAVVIVAGLQGTPIAERNFATVITWNVWWAGLVFTVFFFGSAWCAVCPWDTLATWMVRHRIWRRSTTDLGLNLKVPKRLRNIWPALLLFVGLTWLELGVGVTANPYATAALSLLMVVLATISLAIYEGKAFCRYFCPVGRTVGFYAQLACTELRPIESQKCADCESLACYYGTEQVAACPTHLLMGTLSQSTYCTSCGNCTQSCPEENVSWRLRSPSVEAIQFARPHWDESWFMLGLLSLTTFHGITMLPSWERWMSRLAMDIHDSGQLLASFSIGMVLVMAVPLLLYAGAIYLISWFTCTTSAFKSLFSSLAFMVLPLAFAYHLAHNFNHLLREGDGILHVFHNPLGVEALPLSMADKHQRHLDMLVTQDALFTLQSLLLIFGFWIAVRIIQTRVRQAFSDKNMVRYSERIAFWIAACFALVVNGFHLWLLTQPMTMRM